MSLLSYLGGGRCLDLQLGPFLADVDLCVGLAAVPGTEQLEEGVVQVRVLQSTGGSHLVITMDQLFANCRVR